MHDTFDQLSWRPIHGRPYQPVAYQPQRLGSGESIERAAHFRALVERRRSVRMFATDPVPEQAVVDAIAAAATAPSAAHQQPLTMVLLTDPDIRRRIRQADEADEAVLYGGRLGQEWLAALRPLGTNPVKAYLTEAPYLIVVFQHRFHLDGAGSAREQHYGDASVGIAVGMLVAALHHAGLSTLIHTPSPASSIGEMLGRPGEERAYAILPVGYPAPDCVVPDITRKSLDQILVRV